MGTGGSFSRGKSGRRVKLTTYLHLTEYVFMAWYMLDCLYLYAPFIIVVPCHSALYKTFCWNSIVT